MAPSKMEAIFREFAAAMRVQEEELRARIGKEANEVSWQSADAIRAQADCRRYVYACIEDLLDGIDPRTGDAFVISDEPVVGINERVDAEKAQST